MPVEVTELDQLQQDYKTAVEEWIAAIHREESLAMVNHTIAEIDKWEKAAIDEDEARQKAKAAKRAYEDALRQKFFNF